MSHVVSPVQTRAHPRLKDMPPCGGEGVSRSALHWPTQATLGPPKLSEALVKRL
ncbi:MAG: hypothetical protein GKS05_05735 [Nitrospirales bacterium]|nr:hypothetical protein [Nitrospirales bacterium]